MANKRALKYSIVIQGNTLNPFHQHWMTRRRAELNLSKIQHSQTYHDNDDAVASLSILLSTVNKFKSGNGIDGSQMRQRVNVLVIRIWTSMGLL